MDRGMSPSLFVALPLTVFPRLSHICDYVSGHFPRPKNSNHAR